MKYRLEFRLYDGDVLIGEQTGHWREPADDEDAGVEIVLSQVHQETGEGLEDGRSVLLAAKAQLTRRVIE